VSWAGPRADCGGGHVELRAYRNLSNIGIPFRLAVLELGELKLICNMQAMEVHGQTPMHKRENKKILAVVSDLFFTVKISEAAKRAGMDVEFVKEEKDLLEKARSRPAMIIFDLNFSAAQPVKVISQLKGNSDLKQTSLLAFVSHVQGDLKQQAHEAGCDMVMARSAFSQNLPQILKRHAGAL